ncbi:hypothetical protein GH714_029069 [Hevea brasiliensis]|uniref:YGGT family protein n=1 Tax=Hevea brasiliensis TaxID=3981 RepID=A0A6A6LS39_HEVBR|nr:hypothetical protein GH714_029069 [Hevea brasiliensis]
MTSMDALNISTVPAWQNLNLDRIQIRPRDLAKNNDCLSSTLCDPYLNIFRGIIPPLGGTLDLSPILAFLVLNAFSSTAAALPAELPKTEASQGSCPPNTRFTNFTTSQKKWMRRLYGNKPQSSTGSN